MFKIGCHLSASNGFAAMGRQAIAIGANTFQFFTRNPRGGTAKPLDEADCAAYNTLAAENNFAPAVAHAPYTVNCCSQKEETRKFAIETIADDLRRLEYVPGNYYNFHPGSHVGQGEQVGMEQIAFALNSTLTKEQKTIVLLETMAGKGTEVGASFEQIRQIIDMVEMSDKLGVCLDTCHVFDGGYDIVSKLDDVLERFDKVIGLDRLKAVHMNDSMFGFESHKDRHAKIGEGHLTLDGIVRIINHPALRELPFVLETPNDIDGYAAEIKLLKSLRK
ncbi:MAG: deoxyribonuclease IV [Ruminococcaceae bacterium]|nr:deoxyribonuclease IV [Oscillospiraceae bacterium]